MSLCYWPALSSNYILLTQLRNLSVLEDPAAVINVMATSKQLQSLLKHGSHLFSFRNEVRACWLCCHHHWLTQRFGVELLQTFILIGMLMFCYMLKVTYFETSMDVVPHECSTIVSLPVHIEGLQSFVEAPDKRTMAFHKFLLADFFNMCKLLPLCVHIDILSSLCFEVAFVFILTMSLILFSVFIFCWQAAWSPGFCWGLGRLSAKYVMTWLMVTISL